MADKKRNLGIKRKKKHVQEEIMERKEGKDISILADIVTDKISLRNQTENRKRERKGAK